MTIINLHVHPFSARILTTDFGLPDQTYIYIPALDIHSNIISSRERRSCKTLTQEIEIHCHVRDVPEHAGASLYHYHKRKCFEYVLACVDSKRSARSAIDQFYAVYDISDDEYDRDSMYREWTRYLGDLRKTKSYPTHSGERRTFVISRIKGMGRDIAAHIVAEHLSLFYDTKDNFNLRMMRQLLTYVDVVVDGKKVKIPARTKRDRIVKWKNYLTQYPQIHNTYRKLTGL
jgi:hypothetical protein